MKVKELINALQSLPQDDEVFIGDHQYASQLLYEPEPKTVDIITNVYGEHYEVSIYAFSDTDDAEDYFTGPKDLRKGWLL